jgi:hypothetical protein
MPGLQKAYIVEISSDEKARELGPRFPVQFNPASLKLQISASMAQGTPSGSQVRQSTGAPTSTLTLELVFDTADEGATNQPRSVREKTAQVERFVFPKEQGEDKQKPPKMRFQWGSFMIDGVVDSINVDLDHFAADGTPLRAKVSLSIKEQNSKLIFRTAAPGANQKGGAPQPGKPSAGAPGSQGGSADQVAAALGGESLPEFAARVGLDPGAWRGLSTGISGSLSGDLTLEAGVEVGFSAGLSANAGLGVTLGVEAGVKASLEASFGLEASAGLSAVAGLGVSAELAAGMSLSAGGGLSAALETVQAVKSQAAEQQARQAFQAPAATGSTAVGTAAALSTTTAAAVLPPAPAPKPALPEQPRAPLTATGIPSPAQQLAAPAAPAPPRADPRAASFGFGVPLRSTVGAAAAQRTASLQGRVPLRSQTGDGLPPSTEDPTVPPWVALPARSVSRADANQVQQQRRPPHPCGCLDGAGSKGLTDVRERR